MCGLNFWGCIFFNVGFDVFVIVVVGLMFCVLLDVGLMFLMCC